MLEAMFAQEEGKTLEFKEHAKGLAGIIKTVVAFANTAGGVLVIGVKDRTKEIVGLADVLEEEERLTNAIADSIAPLLIPDIEMHTYRKKEILVIRVPHAVGPYYLKSEGENRGTYIRFGSTNRIADPEMFSMLKLFAANISFDETPQIKGDIDWKAIESAFENIQKRPTEKTCEMLGILSSKVGKVCPTTGGILLFGKNRFDLFPDSVIRCARFGGNSREKLIDQQNVELPLPFAIDQVVSFIERNSRLAGEIGRLRRTDISEYPPIAIREAVINAVVHADYSMKGCHIQIAIFDDRIEVTNPGGLPFGQTIEKAIAGFSRLRNHVIGRVFRELNLIEQWGSGLQKILAVCARRGLKTPLFEELNNQFRLTVFSTQLEEEKLSLWGKSLISYLQQANSITTKEASKLWKVSDRTARTRLKMLANEGAIQRIGTSENDPRSIFILAGK